MRIKISDNYFHGEGNCDVARCARHYCEEHRLLWRDCDSAKLTSDGSGRHWFELGDCPACEWEAKEAEYQRLSEAYEQRQEALFGKEK